MLAMCASLRGDIFADDLKQFDKAAEEYAKALELDPENADFAEKRDRALQAIADSDQAALGVESATQLSEPLVTAEQ